MEPSIAMISLDKTIIEVLDKKWKKYLIPRINILKAKYTIELNPSDGSPTIQINDKDDKQIDILKQIIADLNEDNLTYQWLQVLNTEDKPIIVKKEQLYQMKISNESFMIMDYYAKKHHIIPSKTCRIAKKYKTTEGKGFENILFKIKDEDGIIHFITKPIIKFAKKKRMLNDDSRILEITNKEKVQINVPIENIRDIDDFNPYSEWCEIKAKDNNNNSTKIIVKKMDLQDLKEQNDKNYIKEEEQKIMDWKYQVHIINPNKEYEELFPDKYSYLPNNDNKWEEYSTITTIEGDEAKIKTKLIEYYLNDNINDLAFYEEANNINGVLVNINPYDIVKKIILNYHITSQKGIFVELVTQSGNKHLIKISMIKKAIEVSNTKKEEYVSIKGSMNEKIITTFQKIKELDIDDDKLLLIPLEDSFKSLVYVNKVNIKEIVNRIVSGEPFEEYEEVIDYLGGKKLINVKQIQMKNTILKKNFDMI